MATLEPVIAFDVGERQTGKTTRLIEWAAAAPEGELRVVVSHTMDMARTRWRQARTTGLGLEEWQFVSFGVLARRGGSAGLAVAGRRGRIVLGIDDLNHCLPVLLGFDVTRVTATGGLVLGRSATVRGPIHELDAGRYRAVLRDGVPIVEREDDGGAVTAVLVPCSPEVVAAMSGEWSEPCVWRIQDGEFVFRTVDQ